MPPKRRTAKIAILWAVVLLSLVCVAWLALPWRLGGSKAEAEAHGTAAIVALQHSLAAYEASEHSFPASLEALASAAREASREAEAGRYTIQYMPGKPRSDGRIISYTLTARAGNYAYLNLFADETGQIHGTRENRLATAQDPVITKSPPINP